MNYYPRTLLTIVTESSLEKELVDFFKSKLIRGWTIAAARGNGKHGERDGIFDANENIRIELVADDKILQSLAIEIQQKFGNDYALVQWLNDVRVLRGDKF